MEPGTYRRSLKSPAGEEFFDLLFFRPAAYLLVRLISRTPITPNQVTGLSLAAGLAAAWGLSWGNRAGMTWGAVLYALANVLDCADGQLARLKNTGTLLGRVVDGAADYISGVFITFGLGLGLANSGRPMWGLVILAGISSAIHATFFDFFQSEFLARSAGKSNFIDSEAGRFAAEMERMRSGPRALLKTWLLRFYLSYLRIQKILGQALEASGSRTTANGSDSAAMIRIWSFLGPTTNRTILIICALFGRIDYYLWIVVGAGNAWLAFAYILEARYRRRIMSDRRPASEGTR